MCTFARALWVRLHMAPHGSTWAPRTRNVISWSQCVLSLQQTAVTLATFRHILLENHAFVMPRPLRPQRPLRPSRSQSAPWLSTIQARSHRTHNLISWSQCVLSVYQTAVTLDTFRHILLENHGRATCTQRANDLRAMCVQLAQPPQKPDETTCCARRLVDRKHTLGTC